MYYSKSTNGFYTEKIHGANIPNDAVEITETEHVTLLAGQSAGKVIMADNNGNPILSDPPELTAGQIVAALKVAAQMALDKSDITILRCYEAAIAVPTAWQTYRAELRAIISGSSIDTVLPTMPDYPVGK